MSRFAKPVFLAAGLRTAFGRGGGALATYDAISLSVPVVQAMAQHAEPDFVVWGTVIPNLGWSNIAREVWLDAKLNPSVPAFSVVLACSTSMTATFAAAGMLGGGADLSLVGGAEVMSRPSLALTAEASKRLTDLFAKDAGAALAALQSLTVRDYVLPTKGWANRITGRTMGDHMEETAKAWNISRAAQDDWALKSHQRAVAGWTNGFFDDLVVPLPELTRDANPRADTSIERLAALKPAFDRDSGLGSITAGNSSPITDGAAGCWVANEAGIARLPTDTPHVRLVDYEVSAVDLHTEGLLMAPSYGIPRLLSRHRLGFSDIALWEIHEAFAAQVLANVAAITDPDWVRAKAGVEADMGPFDWERVNPMGGSVAIGHPFGATGARDLSQAVKELWALPVGARAIVSICADGGQGTVALLERV
ncbi:MULTISPECIES: thiolase family protein [Sphingomonadaceae]|jgi:acetyl-CoA C-acetyltransferase|uniref:Thiolase family protein n=1 Tax=Sphingomonas paucimobilis TaxID=13689 RepID=A0A7T3AEN2_SPHPI|nr:MULTISPECIES: thiolase family protein [Sphingomonadaceae]MCM3681050.1 thiolase family protein [Sphingomonas paucimobilis]QPT11197.1 thiolase family protein [Sphingomonas paucimobilis]SMD01442.1 acetyl-CoA C-acetyltransferase/acetyl-CoA acyltransferase [Novosphingobium sp. B1]